MTRKNNWDWLQSIRLNFAMLFLIMQGLIFAQSPISIEIVGEEQAGFLVGIVIDEELGFFHSQELIGIEDDLEGFRLLEKLITEEDLEGVRRLIAGIEDDLDGL